MKRVSHRYRLDFVCCKKGQFGPPLIGLCGSECLEVLLQKYNAKYEE